MEEIKFIFDAYPALGVLMMVVYAIYNEVKRIHSKKRVETKHREDMDALVQSHIQNLDKLTESFKALFLIGVDIGTDFSQSIIDAKNTYISLTMSNAERAINSYINKRTQKFKELNPAVALVNLHRAKLDMAFEEVLNSIREIARKGYLPDKQDSDFEMSAMALTRSDFNSVKSYLLEHYDDALMQVPLETLLSTIDMREVEDLGKDVYGAMRDCYNRYKQDVDMLRQDRAKKVAHALQSLNISIGDGKTYYRWNGNTWRCFNVSD